MSFGRMFKTMSTNPLYPIATTAGLSMHPSSCNVVYYQSRLPQMITVFNLPIKYEGKK